TESEDHGDQNGRGTVRLGAHELDGGGYREMHNSRRRARRIGAHIEELDLDHQPSSAAVAEAAGRALGRSLTPDDATRLHDRATAVGLDPSVHAETETFRGNNTPARINEDALDLRRAADSNFDHVEDGLLMRGHSQSEIDQARAQMHQ